MIAKKYRRDWAFICLSVRITTLLTGLAAAIYLIAVIILEIRWLKQEEYGYKRQLRELKITILISLIFICIDGYFS